jgi:hypothetical protein
MPIVYVILMLSIFTGINVIYLPGIEARKVAIQADTKAVNMLAYKSALITYLRTNPTFTGVILDSSITLPTGMTRDSNWTNVVSGGVLYVYEGVPSGTQNLLDAIYLKTEKSYLVGKRVGSNYVNAKGYTVSVFPSTSPSTVPDGSIVIIGR